MDVTTIALDKAKARELYDEYKAHRHYSTPIDDEIRKTYKAISQGKVVIQALESIKQAGLGPDGLPKLAIGRADLAQVLFNGSTNGSAKMASSFQMGLWRRSDTPAQLSTCFEWPAGSFPFKETFRSKRAMLPLIPVHLRPRQALDAYHVLWEAEWQPIPPRDPYLLRRIGKADLWMVVAAWDLTPVERAALATRIQVQ